ncbi:MAG: MFS transporter [Rubrivivax sp.]|nr:MFS transporter [Rubrivivax sp.]
MPGHRMPLCTRLEPALVVIAAGVCAALHIGKLPPAITTLGEALGLTLVQAGFLLSLVQAAGMTLGLAFGAVADGLGLRRSMITGLCLLAAASALGGAATAVPALMLLRAVEGLGFLLVVLPAPALVRQLVAPERVHPMLGLWGAYMPFATALALLAGPGLIQLLGWRGWWWGLGGLSLAMALLLARAVPAVASARTTVPAAGPPAGTVAAAGWAARLRQTLAAPGPWAVAVTFAMYSGQWLAVIGFLPAIYTQAGVSGAATAVLTALAAAANMAGNIGSGRLLQRGVPAPRLLAVGFTTMAVAAAAAFAGGPDAGLPGWLRYTAVLAFSGVGGLIPATLFALALRLAPGPHALSTTVGWVQQWSALGQFAGPPLVAWVASRAGGWQWTWVATGSCSLAGLLLTLAIAHLLQRRARGGPGAGGSIAPGRA